jgi:hypothetical protein
MTASTGAYRLRRDAKITPRQTRAAWVLYQHGYSLRAIAALIWQPLGFASPKSAANSLHDRFRAAGYRLRDRLEATRAASTTHGLRPRSGPKPEYLALRARRRRERGETHGRICTARVLAAGRRHGRPCSRSALADSDLCYQHDPRHDRERRANLERARQIQKGRIANKLELAAAIAALEALEP